MTSDWHEMRLALDKRIRSHKLDNKMTVSAAVEWLSDPAKKGSHDPLQLVRELQELGLDYTHQHIGNRRLIRVVDPFKLKLWLDIDINLLGANPWLYTRGDVAAGCLNEQPLPHRMDPFTGLGLADAMAYMVEYRTQHGTIRDIARELVTDISQDRRILLIDELRRIGIKAFDGRIVIYSPTLVAIAMPALRNVPMLLTPLYSFELTSKPKPARAMLEVVKG